MWDKSLTKILTDKLELPIIKITELSEEEILKTKKIQIIKWLIKLTIKYSYSFNKSFNFRCFYHKFKKKSKNIL